MGSLSCCVLLALALLGPHAAAARKCELQGLWRNELGSNMTLSALDAAGIFSGSYHTAVAATNKQILVSPLQGAQQRPGAKGQPTFGFTVQWQFAV
ncbi:avidin-like [Mycteria americana]|uniref:avidin-like n=1 Tax=Mycteria americana TaxID=33587 RepID=UPI003F584444